MSARGRSAGRSSPVRAGQGGERGRPSAGRPEPATDRRDRGPRRESGGAARPAGTPAARRERLREVVEPVVTGAGYDLEEVTVSRAGRRHLVRIVVDGDGGVTLDSIADVSRAVSAALDLAEESGGELFEGEYALEVGSPGVDRPLTLPRHWRRNVGRLVKVQAKPPAGADDGDRQLTGRVLTADDAGIVLDVGGEPRELTYGQLGPGRVQIEFTRLDEVNDDDLDEIGGADEPDDEADMQEADMHSEVDGRDDVAARHHDENLEEER